MMETNSKEHINDSVNRENVPWLEAHW